MKIVYSYHGGIPSEFLLKMAELSFLSVRNYTEYPIELWVDKSNYWCPIKLFFEGKK